MEATRQKLIILAFAFTGNCSVLIAYSYPAGFILAYLKQEKIDYVTGMLAVHVCQITALISPWIVSYLPGFWDIDLKYRATTLCLTSAACSASLAGVQCLSYVPRLVLIGVSRAVLGAVLGVFFVIVQGEVVDRYFKDNKLLILLIGSGIYAGTILGGITGAALFSYHGWVITGPVIGCFHLIPLLFVFCINTDKNEETKAILGAEKTESTDGTMLKSPAERMLRRPSVQSFGNPTTGLTSLQYVAYFVPDFVFFMNNVGFAVLTYAIPLRMFEYNGENANAVFYELNVICAAVILPGIAFSYLIGKWVDVCYGLMVSNALFYIGSLLMYASTTPFLAFNLDFEVSSVLVGLGNASISNLIILSKFVMFEKWLMRSNNLGQHATTVFNVIDSLGQIVGAIISGFSLQNRGGIPTLSVFFAFMIVTTFSLVLCKVSYKVN